MIPRPLTSIGVQNQNTGWSSTLVVDDPPGGKPAGRAGAGDLIPTFGHRDVVGHREQEGALVGITSAEHRFHLETAGGRGWEASMAQRW